MFLKKKKKDNACDHEYKVLGKCYTVNLTEFKNRFDMVVINKIYYCSKCKTWNVEYLGTKEFPPSMHHESSSEEMNDYIKELEEKGVISHIAMNEKIQDMLYFE